MKLLIVDDRKENLYLLETLLKASGYQVVSARNGVEALERLKKDSIDMIISDVLMPKMDGFQLCRKCKSNPELRKIPFLFHSATYTDKRDEEFALSLGAEKFIIKPAEPNVLLNILEGVIKKYEKEALVAPERLVEKEADYLSLYNERLIKKLEKKMLDLEKANKALRESEQKYRQLVDNANDAVIIIDPESYLSFINPKFCQMTGYTREEARRLHFSKLVHPEDSAMVTKNFKKKLSGEETPGHYEFRVLTKLGETICVDYNSTVIQGEERIVGIQAVIRDLTERKEAEEEKEKLQAQLLQAQKLEAVGILAGGVAHDFNNLLTAILGYTDLCMMRVDEADPLYRDLRQIRISSSRAADLTRQLLAFSRRQPIRLTSLNLNKTVEGLKKMLARLLGEDIMIETELAPDPWTVEADEGQIEQVIMNLAVNAREAMPQGGRLTVKTKNVLIDEAYLNTHSEAKIGRFVCLSLQDSGVGMDKEIIKHIFEPFFTTREVGKGTGLGLSVVYGIVKQHQGWINVYSEVNQGSVFKVYLPVSSGKAKDEVKETLSLKHLQGKGEKILLVEDEENVLEYTGQALQENGYLVFEAKNMKEAFNIFEEQKEDFNLIFSDVVLPDGSGLELVKELLSRKPDLFVLLSSGYADRKSQWSLIEKKGFPFLEKPYSLADLLGAVKKYSNHGD